MAKKIDLLFLRHFLKKRNARGAKHFCVRLYFFSKLSSTKLYARFLGKNFETGVKKQMRRCMKKQMIFFLDLRNTTTNWHPRYTTKGT